MCMQMEGLDREANVRLCGKKRQVVLVVSTGSSVDITTPEEATTLIRPLIAVCTA